jgi:autoinducer 2-degrading protein
MFVMMVFIETRRDSVAEMRAALLLEARESLTREPGCRRFDVLEDPLEPAGFVLYQGFDDEAAYRAHIESERYAAFAVALEAWTLSKRVLTYTLISNHGLA